MREEKLGRQKMPFRRWSRRPRPSASAKVSIPEEAVQTTVVPIQVRIEVQSGRDASANTVRALRILKQVEESGGLGEIVEVDGVGSTLIAEVDAAQAESLAQSPFVRRIVSLN